MRVSTAALATAACCALAAAAGLVRAGDAENDRFGISGGGARSMLVGLVFLDELEQQLGLKVPAKQTQGLSGGAWGVMLAEAYGPGEALKRYRDFVGASKDNLIGDVFKSLGKSTKKVWVQGVPAWRKYVDSVLVAPVVKDGESDNVYSRSSEALVVTGAAHSAIRKPSAGNLAPSITPWRSGRFSDRHCVLSTTTAAGEMECSETFPAEKLQSFDFKAVSVKIEDWKMTRQEQAVATSSAFLFISMADKIPVKSNGLPTIAPLAERQPEKFPKAKVSNHYALYDEGLACNLPMTRREMLSHGTTVMIDASFYKKYHQAMDGCIKWWADHTKENKHFGGFNIRAVHDPKIEVVHWMGYNIHVADLKELGHTVRVYRFEHKGKDTERRLVVVQFARLQKGVLVKEKKRMKTLETVNKLTQRPKRFREKQFKLMDEEGREFFREVIKRSFLKMQERTLDEIQVTGRKKNGLRHNMHQESKQKRMRR